VRAFPGVPFKEHAMKEKTRPATQTDHTPIGLDNVVVTGVVVESEVSVSTVRGEGRESDDEGGEGRG
jgi:hypothetical protein